MSDISYKTLEKNFKTKYGNQKYNFFVDRRAEKGIKKGYDFSKRNIYDSTRIIERSLRTIVKNDALETKIPATNEEKSIELLSRQQ